MKKFFTMGMSALVLVSLTGCELFDKVDDVTFEATLPLEFVINEQMVSQDPVAYSDVETLDATDDPDVAKYKDKIREIKLNGISYSIDNFAAPGAVSLTNGSIKIASGKTLVTASGIAMENTTDTELTGINQEGFDAFSSDVLGDKTVAVNFDGTFSQTPVAFTLTAYFHVTITADALK